MKKIILALTLIMCLTLVLTPASHVHAATSTYSQTMKKTEIPYFDQIVDAGGDIVVLKNPSTEALLLITLNAVDSDEGHFEGYFGSYSTNNHLYAFVDNVEGLLVKIQFVKYELEKGSTKWTTLQTGEIQDGRDEQLLSLDVYTIVYCDSDIKNVDTDTVFFSALTSLEKVAREANWMSLLLTLKPLMIPITIIVASWVAFRKGWSFLKTALHQA